ncbi:LysM peptidoglycan-binding domain-containing protein [Candidatus Omnitrophota bacterium]
MKVLITCSLLVTLFLLPGCLVRTTSYEVDRVDQEIKGNRGMLKGEAPPLPEIKKKKTRKIYEVEVELVSSMDAKEVKKEDVKKIKAQKPLHTPPGNKGYIERKAVSKKEQEVSTLKLSRKPQVVYQKPAALEEKDKKEERDKIYIVEEGDTIQKISKKMYGTTKKWEKIYEANRNILKSPDLIRPGQKLVIPMK